MAPRTGARLDAIRDELADRCATEYRACAVCGEEKPLAAFYAKLPKASLGSPRSVCQLCRESAKAAAESRRRSRDEFEASLKAERAARAKKLADISARIAAGEHPLAANGWTLTTVGEAK